MVVRERFRIADLVERTGVPPATIHHYLRLGLLPAPRKDSPNRFLYDDRHVQALRLIKTLRERRRLPLSVIRRVLPDLLGLEEEQSFRPEMWDRVVGVHFGRGSRRTPAARLLDAAVDAFSRRGYGDINVDDICRAARIAKGSFYRHYRSKEDLFFAAAEAACAEAWESFARAMPAGAISEAHAAAALARAIEPRLPVFLDLFARALQRRPGYRTAVRRIFGALSQEVGERVRPQDPLAAGTAVTEQALGRVLRDLMQPTPLVEAIVPTPAAR